MRDSSFVGSRPFTWSANEESEPCGRLVLARSSPFLMWVSSVEPPPISTSVPFCMFWLRLAPRKPRWASSSLERMEMRLPTAPSISAAASCEFVQLRSTAVAKMSMRSQLKCPARARWALMVFAARRMPCLVMAPSLMCDASPAIAL